MAHRSSVAAISEAAQFIVMEKNVDHLHVHPNIKNSNHLKEQLAKYCAALRTTAWRCQSGYLPFALSESALTCATNGVLTGRNLPIQDKINKKINDLTSDYEQLGLKANQDALWIERCTKIACLDVEVKITIAGVGSQYLK